MLNKDVKIISDEEYSIQLKKMNEYCNDNCTNCSRNRTCPFIEMESSTRLPLISKSLMT